MENLVKAGIIAFIVLVILQVVYVIVMVRIGLAVKLFIKNTEAKLNPAIEELQAVLQQVKKAAGDASAVTGTVREMTDTVVELKRSVQTVYDRYKSELNEAARGQIAGLKAGLKAGVTTLVRNLSKEKNGP
jgi:phage-related tail protein